jgi:geranylgeranyl diphosphate synthase type I
MELMMRLEPRRKAVNDALIKMLDVGNVTKLKKAMSHLPLAGGKRLRPILTMLVADAVSNKGKKTIPFGNALEIIHNFTLVHDDIMDNDNLRRGKKTVHVLFDEPTAIIAGDALFARAFEILAILDVGNSKIRILLKDVAHVVMEIVEGQQMDMDFENRLDVDEDEYLEMIKRKTAALFAVAAKGGAIIGDGTEKQITSMEEYGRLLGMGFQIWDDYLDVSGKERKLGKPVGSDIKNGKRTLMVVHALKRLNDEDRKRFLSVLGNENASTEEVNSAIALLEKAGSINYAKTMAFNFAAEAKKRLDVLPQSEHKEILNDFVDFMVKRDV